MSIGGNQPHQISTMNIEQEEIPISRTNSSTESQQQSKLNIDWSMPVTNISTAATHDSI